MCGPDFLDTIFRAGESGSGAGSGTAAWTLTESDGRRARVWYSASGRVTLGLAMNIDCAVQPGHADVYRTDLPQLAHPAHNLI